MISAQKLSPWHQALKKVIQSADRTIRGERWPSNFREKLVDVEIDFCGGLVEVTCSYYYHPGEDCKRYGDPLDCYEGSPEEFYINWVSLDGIDIYPLLDADQIEYVEKIIRDAEGI